MAARPTIAPSSDRPLMFFQRILKGISGLNDTQASEILLSSGIFCNWWRKVGTIRPDQIQEKLTTENLMRHLNEYDDPEVRDNTPFISTSAGAVERDVSAQRNVLIPPLLTCLQFATDSFKKDGHIFYGYVCTLGKPAVPLEGYAEEVRDLLVYSSYLPFFREGEIAAKVHIPSVQLEKSVRVEVSGNGHYRLRDPVTNPSFEPPERYANVRGVIAP